MKWREFVSIFYGDLTEKSVTRAAAGRGVFFTVCAFTQAMETREALSILSFFYFRCYQPFKNCPEICVHLFVAV